MNLDFAKWTAANQTAFEAQIKAILPPSFPLMTPFKYYAGSVIAEISVSSTSNSSNMLFLQQQVTANMNTAAFASYQITSIALAPSSSGSAGAGTSSPSGKGGLIAGIIVGIIVVVVLVLVINRYKRSDDDSGDGGLEMNFSEAVKLER